MPFELIDPAALAGDPLDAEAALLERDAAGDAVAHVWQAPVSLIVPRAVISAIRRWPRRGQNSRGAAVPPGCVCRAADWCRRDRAF